VFRAARLNATGTLPGADLALPISRVTHTIEEHPAIWAHPKPRFMHAPHPRNRTRLGRRDNRLAPGSARQRMLMLVKNSSPVRLVFSCAVEARAAEVNIR
jgi:hypothetical protein